MVGSAAHLTAPGRKISKLFLRGTKRRFTRAQSRILRSVWMGCDNQSDPVLFCHKLTRNQRHSRLDNTAGRNSAGPIEAAYTCKLDSHIATGRSRAAVSYTHLRAH